MSDALKKALAALEANDQWHKDHDDHDGYDGSDLQEQTGTAITALCAAIAQPPAPTHDQRLERMRHIANEWADMATNGMQWLRNIKEGISTVDEAIAGLNGDYKHCRKVNDAPGLYGQVVPPAPTAQPAAPTWTPNSPSDPSICNERSAQACGPVYCGDSGGYCNECPKRKAAPTQAPPCKGMNCGCTDGVSHSLECHAEHAAAIAGGTFVHGTQPVQQPTAPLQGRMDNVELLAAWQKKLPGVETSDTQLKAFAVGVEVGFARARDIERQDWSRVHHALAKHGAHPGRTDDHLADVIDRALAAPAQRQPLTPSLRRAAEFTRADLGPAGSNYPHVRELLAFAEQALGITAAPAAQKGEKL